jgi:hypothetical protein
MWMADGMMSENKGITNGVIIWSGYGEETSVWRANFGQRIQVRSVTLIHAVKVENLPMGSSAGATAGEWSASGAEIPGQGRKVSRHDTIQVLSTQKNYFVS